MDKQPQRTRITHVNSTGLDPFSFAVKDSALKKGTKKKTGRWEGVGVCVGGGGVALFSQMKWKARVAAICQSKRRVQRWVRLPGDFFYFFFHHHVPSQITWRKRRRIRRGRGDAQQLRWERWIYWQREGDFKQLRVFRCSALVSYAASSLFFFLPNIHPIRHRGQELRGILKSKSDCGQLSVEGVSVCWEPERERERNEAKRKKETSGSQKVSRAGIPH